MSSGKDNIWYNEGKTKKEIRKAIAAKEITSILNIPELPPNFFADASNELKINKQFVLQNEILTVALVKDAGSLIDCFDVLNSSSDANFLNDNARTI